MAFPPLRSVVLDRFSAVDSRQRPPQPEIDFVGVEADVALAPAGAEGAFDLFVLRERFLRLTFVVGDYFFHRLARKCHYKPAADGGEEADFLPDFFFPFYFRITKCIFWTIIG